MVPAVDPFRPTLVRSSLPTDLKRARSSSFKTRQSRMRYLDSERVDVWLYESSLKPVLWGGEQWTVTAPRESAI